MITMFFRGEFIRYGQAQLRRWLSWMPGPWRPCWRDEWWLCQRRLLSSASAATRLWAANSQKERLIPAAASEAGCIEIFWLHIRERMGSNA